MPGWCGSGTQRRGCGEEGSPAWNRGDMNTPLCSEYGAVATRIPGSSGHHHSGREKMIIKDRNEAKVMHRFPVNR